MMIFESAFEIGICTNVGLLQVRRLEQSHEKLKMKTKSIFRALAGEFSELLKIFFSGS